MKKYSHSSLFSLGLFILFSFAFVIQPEFASAQLNTSDTFIALFQTRMPDKASCEKSIKCLCAIGTETIATLLLAEYGSIFAAAENVKLPDRCLFENEMQVQEFQRKLVTKSAVINGVIIELQAAAMEALLAAKAEIQRGKLRITPLDGSIAGKRSYSDTTRIWNSRFLRGLDHWTAKGMISQKEANRSRNADVITQLQNVLGWESRGFYFSTDFSRSILSSTAPPGSSQHLSLLAFDVVQYSNRNVRWILNKYGWFQTVANDPPHFTYLGFTEKELPSRGLKNIVRGNYIFWLPNFK